jgi:hypothetical protein
MLCVTVCACTLFTSLRCGQFAFDRAAKHSIFELGYFVCLGAVSSANAHLCRVIL